MLAPNVYTIAEHHEKVGSRFQLAQIIMKRTNQLLQGAKPAKGIRSKFRINKKAPIPNQTLHRVALEELRRGKLTWKNEDPNEWAKNKTEEQSIVVFGE